MNSLKLLTSLLPVMRRPVQFSYRVTVSYASITPKFTFITGYPPAFVNWGDGSALAAVTSGTELTHAYNAVGTFTVRLVMPRQDKWIYGIDLNNDKVSGGVTAPQKFPNLNTLYLHLNAALVQDVSGWVLPATLVNFSAYTTAISGDITAWVLPAGLATFQCYGSLVSGDISAWIIRAGMVYFYVRSTVLTGVPVLSSMVAIKGMGANDCGLSQASVDLYLSRCVAREAATTWATPALDLAGTNAAPSAQGVTDKNTLAGVGWVVTVTV